MMAAVGMDFHFEQFSVDLIATDLSSQFMTHITTSVYLGLLAASPYIMLVAAIITPPDLMTLVLVTIPLYLLYEISIRVAKWVER